MKPIATTMDTRTIRKRAMTFLMAAGLVLAAMAGVAHADPGKGGKGRGHDGKPEHAMQHHDDSDKITIVIGGDDRRVINDYLNRGYRKNCPPGLAKKNNGCLPPGIAKKYRVGYPLGDDVRWNPVPKDLLDLLSPAPRGYQYVEVDKDILLIGEASKKVIDAVTLLSAVGE